MKFQKKSFPSIGNPVEDQIKRTNKTVTIVWEPTFNAANTEYWLYMSVGKGTPYSFSEIYVTTQTQFTIENIDEVNTYSFKLQMRTDCGLVPISRSLSLYFGPPTRPPSTSLT